ncbi:MAG: DUF411 domain-containing protein [bacterium]|nr:DUF411 domain-containing protein [bacterium]
MNIPKVAIIALFLLLLAAGAGFLALKRDSMEAESIREPNEIAAPGEKSAVVYRSLSCGCCGGYVDYLKKNGFSVSVEPVSERFDRSEKFGIPSELGSCHTTVIDGYVIEGHVPLEAVQKLLDERPVLRGISLPQMPIGSPGMPGPKTEAFEVKGFLDDGSVIDFMAL